MKPSTRRAEESRIQKVNHESESIGELDSGAKSNVVTRRETGTSNGE